MPRIRPETVTLHAEDVIGRTPEEGRDQTLSATLSTLLDALDDSARDLPLETEPADFTKALEELSEGRKS